MSCADSIGKLLADAHFTSCFTKVLPSALYCGKPIVVTEGTFLRNSRMAEEERGSVVVTVLVVREVMADAESVALAAEPAVSIDCETEGVTIDGIDARAYVTLASAFFSLSPGSCELSFTGCSSHATSFRERWI